VSRIRGEQGGKRRRGNRVKIHRVSLVPLLNSNIQRTQSASKKRVRRGMIGTELKRESIVEGGGAETAQGTSVGNKPMAIGVVSTEKGKHVWPERRGKPKQGEITSTIDGGNGVPVPSTFKKMSGYSV